MAIYARGACTVTTSLCCCGMPLCRMATGTEPQSTTVGSMRSTGCSAARSTSISRPTPCFLMGACGPRGLLGPTWMMLWRRLLTWHSLPCARRTWLLLWACPSHCTISRTDLTQSGRLAWMRLAIFSGSLPQWLGVHGRICPASVLAIARHSVHRHRAMIPSCWLCQGSQGPHLGDQPQGSGGWCRASAGQ
jgi:hypothetical protein